MKYTVKKKSKERKRAWGQFFLHVSIAVVLFTLGIFIGLLVRNNLLINHEIKTRAESHIHQILKTREWNAHYGGVYVEKKEGVESNPYLENPDITTTDGKIYTLRNPALMTREISMLFEEGGGASFHLTSLKPLNPENRADAFEARALKSFEKGVGEVFAKEKEGASTSFRYMIPLPVKQECLQCHAKQGYKVGDIRGGISIRFDITATEKALMLNKVIILSLGILSAATLIGVIYSFALSLMRKLERAQKKIEKMAITDDLTELYNRRFLFSRLKDEVKRAKRFGQNLGCVLLDIDFFKEVNDRYGHQAGDVILQGVSGVVKGCCRETDVIARYGGEEIVVILPGTDLKGVYNLAEKVRQAVEQLHTALEKDITISVTVSAGAAAFTPDDLHRMSSDEEIIKYADEALYRAKERGRNRVEIAESIII